MLRIEPANIKGTLAFLLLADVFMYVVTGYIGEQQLDTAGHIIVGQKLLWGAIPRRLLGYSLHSVEPVEAFWQPGIGH